MTYAPALQKITAPTVVPDYFFARGTSDWTTWTILAAVPGLVEGSLTPGAQLAGPITVNEPNRLTLASHVTQLTLSGTPNALALGWTRTRFGVGPADPRTWVWDWQGAGLLGPVAPPDGVDWEMDRMIGPSTMSGRLWWTGRKSSITGGPWRISSYRAEEDLSGFGQWGGDYVSPPPPVNFVPTNVWTCNGRVIAPITRVGLSPEITATWSAAAPGLPVEGPLLRAGFTQPATTSVDDVPAVQIDSLLSYAGHNSVGLGGGGPWFLPGFVTAPTDTSVRIDWFGYLDMDAKRLRYTVVPSTGHPHPGMAVSSYYQTSEYDVFDFATGVSAIGGPKTLELPVGTDEWFLFPYLTT